ncbi:hypothetical protein LAZ67_15002372 [Cordylochernes scorpioides]|uniref:Uncharacterized protein n=1 Tax=Cordylochernes scorpioides TaxID=51811 RepID=A0ABY6LC53_9ARAC|nr:hypothetical protein LAZ67_15002372 [Cordylochernes scorpioides]
MKPSTIYGPEGHKAPVTCLHVTSSGRWMLTGSEDTDVIVWDLNLGTLRRRLSHHIAGVSCVTCPGSEQLVLSGSEIGVVIVAGLETGSPVRRLENHRGPISCLAVNVGDDIFISGNSLCAVTLSETTYLTASVTGSTDRTLCVWNLDDCELLNTITLAGSVRLLAVSPDSTFVAAACGDGAVHVRALATGSEVHQLPGFNPSALEFARDSCRLVLGARDGKIHVVDIHAARTLHTLAGHTQSVVSLTALEQDRFLVSAGGPKVVVWNFCSPTGPTGHKPRLRKVDSSHQESITCVAVSRDGTLAVTGSVGPYVKSQLIHTLVCPRCTELQLWRRWLEQGNVAIYRNAGATRVTSARVDRRILRQAEAAPQATCTAILQHVQDTLDHSISTRTISRRLVANGLHSCRPLRRLPLIPPNRRQRLEWCRARSTWMTEWHRVVFSDESRFCLSSDSRRVRVWRRRGERSNPAAIVERPTVRQRGIMVWGAIAYDSRSPLLRIQGTMTAQRYVDDVLRPVTLPYLQGVPNALYQQDNARPHTACISQQALQDLQMLPWPPYSPDLSPIEHVWDIIGRRLHALPQPRSEDELWQMVEREWRAIPQDAIRTLIDSLPRRVAACIACGGMLTGSKDGQMKVWHLATGDLHTSLEGHQEAITCVTFAPNGLFAVSGSEDCTLKVWGLTLGMIVSVFKEHLTRVLTAAVTADSRLVLSTDAQDRHCLWLADSGAILQTCIRPTAQVSVHSTTVFAVAGKNDSSLEGKHDSSLKFWPLADPDKERTVSHSDTILCYAVSHDCQTLITGSQDMSLKVWEVRTAKLTQVLVGHDGSVTCVAVAPYSQALAVSGSLDATLIVWDITTGADRFTLRGHTEGVKCVLLNLDGSVAISGSDDNTLQLWNVRSGQRVSLVDLHASIVLVASSLNATHLAVQLRNTRAFPVFQLLNNPAQGLTLELPSTALFEEAKPPPIHGKRGMVPKRVLLKGNLKREQSFDSLYWDLRSGSPKHEPVLYEDLKKSAFGSREALHLLGSGGDMGRARGLELPPKHKLHKQKLLKKQQSMFACFPEFTAQPPSTLVLKETAEKRLETIRPITLPSPKLPEPRRYSGEETPSTAPEPKKANTTVSSSVCSVS